MSKACVCVVGHEPVELARMETESMCASSACPIFVLTGVEILKMRCTSTPSCTWTKINQTKPPSWLMTSKNKYCPTFSNPGRPKWARTYWWSTLAIKTSFRMDCSRATLCRVVLGTSPASIFPWPISRECYRRSLAVSSTISIYVGTWGCVWDSNLIGCLLFI